MNNFEDWFMKQGPDDDCSVHDIVWHCGPHKGRDVVPLLEEAYEAGAKSLQNRITELEEIISGYNEAKGSGLGC
jgi:hypothetical protein